MRGTGIWIATLAAAFAAPASAQWDEGSTNDGGARWAMTVNDSGVSLSQTCFVKSDSPGCYWVLATETRCEAGASYPALLSSDSSSSAAHVTLNCMGAFTAGKVLYRYTIQAFDSVDHAVRAGTRLGIAVPLEGGQFTVYRFSLWGAVGVVDKMREKASGALSRSTRNQTM